MVRRKVVRFFNFGNIDSKYNGLVPQLVSLQQWAEQIRDCQSLPKEMDVKNWSAQNDLTKTNYYYRFWCVREVYLR